MAYNPVSLSSASTRFHPLDAINRVGVEVRQCKKLASAPRSLEELSEATIKIGKEIEAIRGQLRDQTVNEDVAQDFNIVIRDYNSLRNRVIMAGCAVAYPPTPTFVPLRFSISLLPNSRASRPSPDAMLASIRQEALAQVAKLSTPAKRAPGKSSYLGSSRGSLSLPPISERPQESTSSGSASSHAASSSSAPVATSSTTSSSSSSSSPVVLSIPSPVIPAPAISAEALADLRQTGVHPVLDRAPILLMDTDQQKMQKDSLGIRATVSGTVRENESEGATVHSGNFDICAAAFSQCGGTILRSTPIITSDLHANTRRIPLDPSKKIYVMDEDGGICSQLVVAELRSMMGFQAVQNPHAALTGVDPVVIPPIRIQELALRINADPKKVKQYINEIDAFGYPRYRFPLPNLGETLGMEPLHRRSEDHGAGDRLALLVHDKKGYFVDKEIFANIAAQRDKMNMLLWDPIHEEGGQIITINGALHPVLIRDTERAKVRRTKDLSSQPRTLIPLTCRLPGSLGREEQAAWNHNFRAAIQQTFAVAAPAIRA